MFGLGINRLGTSTSRLEGAISGLFKNGEAGVWYDPSDVEASLTWRRNLHEYSESFSLWTKQAGVITEDVIAGPYENTLADKFVANNAVNTAWILQDQPIVRGQTYTQTIFAKAGEVSWLQIAPSTAFNTGHQNYNLATGELGTNTSGIGNVASIENIGNGWYRCSLSTTAIATTPTGRFAIGWMGGDDGRLDSNGTVTPDGVKGVYIWGAQIEKSSTATEYQPIRSTFNNAFLQAFPKHTLMQSHQGRTPVTALGQPVGLMLDKSQGVAFGSQLVTTPNFDSATGWSTGIGHSITGGQLVYDGTGAQYQKTRTNISITNGKLYKIVVDIASLSGSSINVGLSDNGTSFTNPQNTLHTIGIHTIYQYADAASAKVQIQNNNATQTWAVNSITVKEVKGSHATQSDSTKRPVFARHPERGRVNLLKYTEEFDNSFWSKTGLSVTANNSIAPDGSTTADKVTVDSGGHLHFLGAQISPNAGRYSFSMYFKAGTSNFAGLRLVNDAFGNDRYAVIINLSTGSFVSEYVVGSPPFKEYEIDNVGNGWYRLTIKLDHYTSALNATLFMDDGNANWDGGTALTAFSGNGTDNFLVWGAQLEEANEATGYQKVVDDYDITESGYKSVYYLQFDGVNDGMQINNLTSSSTPITALFGVTINGFNTWLMDIQTGRTVFGGNNNYTSIFDGGWINGPAQVLNAPTVLTYDAVESDLKIRVDGLTETTSGAYNENPIGGAIGLFQSNDQNHSKVDGNMYQVVLRAAESTDKEIDQAEEFVAIKTGLKSEVAGLATLDLNFGANTYTARNSNGSVL